MLEGNGKFGRAALAVSVIASGTLLALVALSMVLALTHLGTLTINYIIGTTIIVCCLFELMAIALGVVGIFESASKKRAAWTAIVLSLVCFAAILTVALMGMHHTAGAQHVSRTGAARIDARYVED